MITVDSTIASVNGYKVRLFLSTLGIEFELQELDMYGGEHKQEPFLSLNPFGWMPALEDNGYMVAGSHGCLTYLAPDSSRKCFPVLKSPATSRGALRWRLAQGASLSQ